MLFDSEEVIVLCKMTYWTVSAMFGDVANNVSYNIPVFGGLAEW